MTYKRTASKMKESPSTGVKKVSRNEDVQFLAMANHLRQRKGDIPDSEFNNLITYIKTDADDEFMQGGNGFSWPMLHMACHVNHPPLIRACLDHDGCEHGMYSKTFPLHRLVKSYKPIDQSIVDELIEHGGDVDARNGKDETPLHLALHYLPDTGGASAAHRILLAAGASPHIPDHYGSSPFMVATQHGKLRAMKDLKAAGVDVNTVDRFGRTAINMTSNPEIIAFLIAHKADVNNQDRHGETAFNSLITQGSKSSVDACARLLCGECSFAGVPWDDTKSVALFKAAWDLAEPELRKPFKINSLATLLVNPTMSVWASEKLSGLGNKVKK